MAIITLKQAIERSNFQEEIVSNASAEEKNLIEECDLLEEMRPSCCIWYG